MGEHINPVWVSLIAVNYICNGKNPNNWNEGKWQQRPELKLLCLTEGLSLGWLVVGTKNRQSLASTNLKVIYASTKCPFNEPKRVSFTNESLLPPSATAAGASSLYPPSRLVLNFECEEWLTETRTRGECSVAHGATQDFLFVAPLGSTAWTYGTWKSYLTAGVAAQ